MPLNLPPGSTIEPTDESIVCRMYCETGKRKEGSKIIVPETIRNEVFFARVVRAGDGRVVDFQEDGGTLHKPMRCRVGDDILFFRWHGERVTIGEAEYIVMLDEDVIAKVNLPKKAEGVYFRFAGKGEEPKGIEEARVV